MSIKNIVEVFKPVASNVLEPFGAVNKKIRTGIILFWIILILLLFEVFHSPIVPPPSKIFLSLINLITQQEFIDNYLTSLMLTTEAMFISIIITLVLVYASCLQFFLPITVFISKCRYLTMSGVVFLFTVMVRNVGDLKLALLVFGIVPYFVTSFLAVVSPSEIQKQLNKAYVNKMNQWEALLEIVIIGKLDKMFIVMKENFAISWMMITMVEGYAMSEGGIGTLMIKSGKYLKLELVFAMLCVILLTGLLLDWLLSKIRHVLFAYTN